MLKLEFAIFNLKTARMVLRHILAFCGLMAILLTASCGPSSSGSKTKPIPIEDERNEVPESSSQSETLEKTETDPATVNSELQPREIEVAKNEVAPEVKEIPETKIIPMGETAKINSDVTPESSTLAQAPSKTDAQTETNESKTVQATVARLTSNYIWATMPTFIDSYKDPNGQVIEHFKVSPGDSQELKDILAKMRDDLVLNGHSSSRIQLEIKEQGTCETKQCNTDTPICLSLEEVNSEKAKSNIEQALRPLIMREFARQHCADENLAKQVQQYYELPAIRNFSSTNRIFSTFTRLRADLQHLNSALTTGLMPNAGKYSSRIDSKEEICNMIAKGNRDALVLKEQVAGSEFIKDSKSVASLIEIIQGMRPLCEASEDRPELLQRINTAIQVYDQLAQEFSKNSGMIVLDFSKHLWPFENTDGSQN